MSRGTLILVVGPSGSGKDTLIDAARETLAEDPNVVFPRREITRPAEAGGEPHIAISTDTFQARRSSGAYALSWGAHGLFYGIPVTIADSLSRGISVVVNTSRGVIDEARDRFPPTAVISLSVPEDVLRARLAARGRESGPEIERRVARARAVPIAGENVIDIVNDRPLEETTDAFLRAIQTAENLGAERP